MSKETMVLPDEKFVRIETDEGQTITGFSMGLVYNDTHHPTYTGISLADFSQGFPSRKVVYDFDNRDEKEGSHITEGRRIHILSLEEGIEQIRLARLNIAERAKTVPQGSLAQCLIEKYLQTLQGMEAIKTSRPESFLFQTLKTLGNEHSRFFVGYTPQENMAPEGLNDAPLYPDRMAPNNLTGIMVGNPISKETLETVNQTLALTDKSTFWPVSYLPPRFFGKGKSFTLVF